MPPFVRTFSQPQPHLVVRQPPSLYEIVLSITRSSTTYTTTINPTESSLRIATPTLHSNFRRSESSGTTSTGVIIAAILSSILGTMVLITICYKCCIDNRSAAYVPRPYTSYDTDSESERTARSGVHKRGGGWETQYRRYSVRRPDRARTRRQHWEREMSSGRGYRRRRRTARNGDGMLGWVLPSINPYARPMVVQAERSWPLEREFLGDD
ncbi:hypothetical protein B0O99DRAFT_328250 [Bisporella sp. PMI_857]|nr:hypothetical protein B0O99DRAFT_364652 [Bisporella sp. PMI_857]KAH8600533.1 hypothetical protein B0O99DRAFT_328250 [Bisporella sp. PMI_857]